MSTANQAKKNYDHLLKILVVGDSGVGKTCLLFRFANDEFSNNAIATIGIDFVIRTITYNDEIIKLQVWESPHRHVLLSSMYYRSTTGFVVAFDVTNQESFANAEKWLAEVKANCIQGVAIVLAATKIDLTDAKTVRRETAKRFAERMNLEMFETSSKDNVNVDELFEYLTSVIVPMKKEKEAETTKANQQNENELDQNKNEGCVLS